MGQRIAAKLEILFLSFVDHGRHGNNIVSIYGGDHLFSRELLRIVVDVKVSKLVVLTGVGVGKQGPAFMVVGGLVYSCYTGGIFI